MNSTVMKCNFLLAFTIISCALAADCLAAESALVWKLKQGDEQHYLITQSNKMSMNLGQAGATDTQFKQRINMTWNVKSVDENGTAELEQSIDRIRLEMEAPGQKGIEYDTKSDEAPRGYAAMLVPLYKAMTSVPFQATITARGEFTSFVVPKKTVEALKKCSRC